MTDANLLRTDLDLENLHGDGRFEALIEEVSSSPAKKKHEEKKLGVDLDEYLPEGSSAILVVLDDQYLDGVESALTKADKQVNKAIDSGDYDKLQKALSKADTEVDDAVDS